MSETNSTSDWLYILLTLLAAGVSMVKSWSQKNKKRSESELPDPESVPEEFTTEEWTLEKAGSYIDTKTEEKESLISEEESLRKKTPINTQWKEEEATEMEETGFELKKAIIYNEILNRKYE